jgi:ELWxxDGT repeat protein
MKKAILLLNAFLISGLVAAQMPTLINDLSTDKDKSSISDGAGYASPYFLTGRSGKIFFQGSTDGFDFSPYISDGTAAGTIALSTDFGQDIYHSQVYDPIKDRFYYTGKKNVSPYKDYEVWVSDGTKAGTKVLKEIEPGKNGCDPSELTMLGSKLFFAAFSGVGTGLWVSDGTEAGTTLLNTVIAKNLVTYKGKLYFKGYDNSPNTDDAVLWESDGTVAGTKKIFIPANFGEAVNYIKPGAKGLYIAIGSQYGTLCSFDLKTNKYTKLHDSKVVASLLSFNNKDYLLCRAVGTTPSELRETDGTLAGTKAVVTLKKSPAYAMAAEKYIAFSATDTQGEELWISDGTPAGTFEIDLNKGAGDSSPRELTRIGNNIYFAAKYNDGKDYGIEPMVTDGTIAGTKLIADMATGAADSKPRHFALATLAGKPNLIFACTTQQSVGMEAYKLEVKYTSDAKDQNQEDKNLFSIQPNPTSLHSAITLNADLKGGSAQLSIYDLQGKILQKQTIQDNQQLIELSNLNKGIYLIQVITNDARIKTQKLIIQ